jgi:hypothetical protein
MRSPAQRSTFRADGSFMREPNSPDRVPARLKAICSDNAPSLIYPSQQMKSPRGTYRNAETGS